MAKGGFPIPLLFLLLLVFSSLPAGKSDLAADKAALQSFRSAVGKYALSWNDSNSPCTWKGVSCESGRVTVLRLPGVGLVGQLPAGAFGSLTKLRTLSLRFNALAGGLPPDLASCVELRSLHLQDNKFSGQIPTFLFSLQSLIRLNLAGNGFSGAIGPGFNNLTRLRVLYLDRNQLSGQIPDLNLNLVQFNASYNRLNGSIPVKLRSMPANAFLGMSLCDGPLGPCPGEIAPAPEPTSSGIGGNSNGLSGGAIAGIVIGSVAVLLIIVAVLYFLCLRKRNPKTRSVETAVPKRPEVEVPTREKRIAEASAAAAAAAAVGTRGEVLHTKRLVFFGTGPRVFDLEELLRASAEVLGKGTFGTAYKAMLEIGTVVAVKRLKDVNLSEKDFKEKIEEVGAMEHPNLVALRAYYFSKDEKLLVYDYMPMGSLSAILHGNRGSGHPSVEWETRANIALAAARGIEYIHSRGPGASHGNIKSSNVLFAESYDARVSDHGLIHLVSPTITPNRGYRAPEVTDARKVSQKADIYSFGVLLLELITGKAPVQAILNEEGVDLPRWVRSVAREEWTAEVFDAELTRYQNVEEEMAQLLQLAIDCCAQHPDVRPTMSDVVGRIEEIHQANLEPVDLNQQHHLAADYPGDQSS